MKIYLSTYVVIAINTKLEKLSWNELGKLTRDLARKIGTEFEVDAIVGVGNSGTIPAAIIAKILKVNEFYVVTVKLYDENKPPKKLSNKPKIACHNITDLKNKNVLVVDDFTRSGSTLDSVINLVNDLGAKKVKSAVIAIGKEAEMQPDYFARKYESCVIFPWDLLE